MKQIKINHLSLPDKNSVFTDRLYYTVNLGNGIVKKFLNKAEAQKFLNEVSKYLTYKLHECNELYISCFTYYRRAWFYFDHNKTLNKGLADLYAKDRLCESNLMGCSETFKILYKRANWANGNHFVFIHFTNILNSLLEVTEILTALYEKKSSAALQYELEILKTKIIYCKRTIDNYTIELENSFKGSEAVNIATLKIVG